MPNGKCLKLAVATALFTACALRSIRSPQEPDSIPLLGLDGKEVMFADYRAQATVVALWATWCGPCLEELPRVDELYRHYQDDKTVSVLGVCVDLVPGGKRVPVEVKKTVQRLRLKMPMLLDARGAFQRWLSGGQVRNEGSLLSASASLHLPLLLIMDAGGHLRREYGFTPASGADQYLEQKKKLVELALKGMLPPSDPGE